MVVDELITYLTFKANTKDAKKVVNVFKDIGKASSNIGKILAAAAAGIAVVGEKSLEATDRAARWADRLGENFHQMQVLERVVKSFGGTAEGFRSDMDIINTAVNPARIGEFDENFASLMRHLGKPMVKGQQASKVFMDLAEAFHSMSRVQAVSWGEKLGLDDATVDMMRKKGVGGIKEAMKDVEARGGFVNPDDLESVREFNRQLSLLGSTMTGTMHQAFASMSPELIKTVEMTKRWAEANDTIIGQFLHNLPKAAAGMNIFLDEYLGKGHSEFTDESMSRSQSGIKRQAPLAAAKNQQRQAKLELDRSFRELNRLRNLPGGEQMDDEYSQKVKDIRKKIEQQKSVIESTKRRISNIQRQAALGAVQSGATTSAASIAASPSAGSQSVQVNDNKTVNINVYSADPNAAGRSVSREIQRQGTSGGLTITPMQGNQY